MTSTASIASAQQQHQLWLDLHREEIIEPALPIVDPHHHAWDKETRFASGKQERYLLDELLADVNSGHNIVSTVYLQAGRMYRAVGDPDRRSLGETEFVNGLAAMSASGLYGPARICEGIVGFADLRLGARVRDILEAHTAVAGGRFRGVRNMSPWHPDEGVASNIKVDFPPHMLGEKTFREGFAQLAPLGLSFDAWLYFTQISDVADLARAFPDTAIILDHIGTPLGNGPYVGKRDEVFAVWRKSIEDLARCQNVSVKLGGCGMKITGFGFHEQPKPPSSQQLADAWRPYFEVCIDAFGVDRCMFESNFPVDKESYSYAVGWNAFKRIAKRYSGAEKTALFSGTATRVYRLSGNA
jgi:L-fuconolactonase